VEIAFHPLPGVFIDECLLEGEDDRVVGVERGGDPLHPFCSGCHAGNPGVDSGKGEMSACRKLCERDDKDRG